MKLSYKDRVGTRVIVAFGIVLALMTFTSLMSIWRLYSVDEMTRTLVDDKLVRQRNVIDWQSAVALNATRAIAVAKSDSLELGDYFAKQLADGDAAIASLAKTNRQSVNGAQEQYLLAAVEHASTEFHAARDEIFKLKAIGKVQEVEQMIPARMEKSLEAYQHSLRDLLAYHTTQANEIAAEASRVFRLSVILLVAFGGLAVAIGTSFAIYLTRHIVRPVEHAADLAKRVADGDLTTVVDTSRRDEIGILLHALFEMNERLRHIVKEVRQSTQQVAAASSGIAHGNSELSARTGQQVASLERTASTMEEITTTVEQNAVNAQNASRLALAASDIARDGGAVVADVVTTMEAINESARRVVDIISVIDGIAFQTNILALNAAVEAARAGEQGRGFAVVASEVRTLAQRSGNAAREIKNLISDSVDKVHAGSALVSRAGETINEVVRSVSLVSERIAEIATSSTEQHAGIEDVGRSIVEIEDATQQNAVLVQESAASVEAMQDQAHKLAELMHTFKVETTPSLLS